MRHGAAPRKIRGFGSMKADEASPPEPLPRVCALLNKHGANYLIIGAQACILHGMIRTTADVDILVEENEENYKRIIAALAELPDGAAAEMTPADIADNVVVKIADEVEVDVSRRAWKVSYADAKDTALQGEIDGVRIPYVSLEMLIASKGTYREQDRLDLLRLQEIIQMRKAENKR